MTPQQRAGCDADPAYAAKGLSFSEDPAPATGEAPASYVVKTPVDGDGDLYLKLKLVHQ